MRIHAPLLPGGPVLETVIHDGRVHHVHTPRPGLPDLEADLLSAGFVDAHGHPDGHAAGLAQLDLRGATSLAEVLRRVAQAPADGPVVGRSWDQTRWTDLAGLPTADQLEAVIPGREAVLRRIDGHALWVSRASMTRAGIGAHTPDPPGGRLVRDAQGAPTGVLIDTAMELVSEPPAVRAPLLDALADLARQGLTGLHAMDLSDDDLATIEALDARGLLPLRLTAYPGAHSQAAARLFAEGPWRGDRLAVVGIKLYADGALGSRGAQLSADYADDPGNRGLALTDTDTIAHLSTQALQAGAQAAVHAIGDLAVHRVLDAFERARTAFPTRAQVPLRVEHAQVVHPSDLPRFAALGVVASMQPTHITSDMGWLGDRLGAARLPWVGSWAALQRSGAHLVFGSDLPIEKPDPAAGLWAATTRQDSHGHHAPGEVLALSDALRAFSTPLGQPRRPPGDLSLWRLHREPSGVLRPELLTSLVDGRLPPD